MWPSLSARAAELISTSHGVTARATATSPSFGTEPNLPLSGGSVTVDAKSQVRRTAEIQIADHTLWPAHPLDLLSPLGSEMLVEHGLRFPNGSVEWTPLGVFTISKADREKPRSGGPIALSMEDRAQKVSEARFLSPGQTVTTNTVVQEISRIISSVLPAVTVIDQTGNTTMCPRIEYDKDRWEVVEKLANSIAAEVYFDNIGQLVVRNQPTFDQPPAWVITSGRGGILVAKKETISREKVFNAYKASGSRSDGSTPVSAVAYDTDPRSATQWGGPFGQKPGFYSSALLTTQAQCLATATALLNRAKGGSSSISLSAIPNPALEGAEVIQVVDDDGPSIHMADSFAIPLGPADAQDITTRSLELPEEG